MLTKSQLDALEQIDITKLDPSNLVDIQSIHVNADEPIDERVSSYFKQIKNPYAFRVGDTPVKISFSSNGLLLRDAFIAYLTSLRTGC